MYQVQLQLLSLAVLAYPFYFAELNYTTKKIFEFSANQFRMSQDKAQPKEKMYDLVPDNFLDGMRIVPHNFDDPENPQHGDYVNAQLRYDLFYDAYNKVTILNAIFTN